MPTKKHGRSMPGPGKVSLKSPRARAGFADKIAEESIRRGKAQAARTIAARAEYLRRLPKKIRAIPPGSAGLLIAEGDSWFDYPPNGDIIEFLTERGFKVVGKPHWGDRIQAMVAQLPALQRIISKLDKLKPPRAVLLSGGGNDIVEEGVFKTLLNRADSAHPGWNRTTLGDLIDKKICGAYIEMITQITAFCVAKFEKTVPVLIHGYANPVPDGTPAPFVGPWLGPTFVEQGYYKRVGYPDLARCTPLAEELLTALNKMLSELPTNPRLAHVNPNIIYVDLRGELSSELKDEKWKDSWDNELHPTPEGFKRVAQRILAAIP